MGDAVIRRRLNQKTKQVIRNTVEMFKGEPVEVTASYAISLLENQWNSFWANETDVEKTAVTPLQILEKAEDEYLSKSGWVTAKMIDGDAGWLDPVKKVVCYRGYALQEQRKRDSEK